MADPYLGEIRMFAGNFAPQGWALCNGQTIAISSNTALFSLLGTNFGGNGTSTFGLPNLQSSSPVHWGQGPGLSPVVIGEVGGHETVNLQVSNLPSHSHSMVADDYIGDSTTFASGHYLSGKTESGESVVSTGAAGGSLSTLNPGSIGFTGGNQPTPIRSPYLAVTFIIALTGIYPSRS